MILQEGGLVIHAKRRGHPDTPEYFHEGGFVDLVHVDEEWQCTYSTRHYKDIFDADPSACAKIHVTTYRKVHQDRIDGDREMALAMHGGRSR